MREFFERYERRAITIAVWLYGLNAVLWLAFMVPLDWLRFAGCQMSPVP